MKPNRKYADSTHLAFLTEEEMRGNTDHTDEKLPKKASCAKGTEWTCAMLEELQSLANNNVFEVFDKPNNRKIIGCRWVFALKSDAHGRVIFHKARAVGKSFPQVKGFYFGVVFSPVVRFESLLHLLGHVAIQDLELVQVDVKTALLHGDFDDELTWSSRRSHRLYLTP